MGREGREMVERGGRRGRGEGDRKRGQEDGKRGQGDREGEMERRGVLSYGISKKNSTPSIFCLVRCHTRRGEIKERTRNDNNYEGYVWKVK